jgi:hypothetical protein
MINRKVYSPIYVILGLLPFLITTHIVINYTPLVTGLQGYIRGDDPPLLLPDLVTIVTEGRGRIAYIGLQTPDGVKEASRQVRDLKWPGLTDLGVMGG